MTPRFLHLPTGSQCWLYHFYLRMGQVGNGGRGLWFQP